MNRMEKTIRRRRQKHQHDRELFLRVVEFRNSKTQIRKKIDALKQIILHIEEMKLEVKLKIKEIKTRKLKTFLKKTRLISQNLLKNKKR